MATPNCKKVVQSMYMEFLVSIVMTGKKDREREKLGKDREREKLGVGSQ